jgi:hypothetical protein
MKPTTDIPFPIIAIAALGGSAIWAALGWALWAVLV